MTSKARAPLKEVYLEVAARLELSPEHERMLAEVLRNELGTAPSAIPEFRQQHRKRQKTINWLRDRKYINEELGKPYALQFLGFAVLLAKGNSTALELRRVMDRVMREVKASFERDSARTSLSLAELGDHAAPLKRPELLLPALRVMSTSGIGIHLGGNPSIGELAVSFSDQVFEFRDATEYTAWHLRGQLGPGWPSPAGLTLEAPLQLAHLQLVPDAHENAVKALDRILKEPESALVSGNAALDATAKFILRGNLPTDKPTLPQLVRACKDALDFEREFLELGQAVVHVSNALAAVRNTYGDGHGKFEGRNATRAEARFAAGCALLLAEYLLDRWESVASNASRAQT